MHLAFFSPLNPVQSGISDYSEDLLPWLSAWADIDLFVDRYHPNSPSLASYPVYDANRFPSLARRYDAVIYQMGNSPAHAHIYRMLQRYPGVVVLHDHVLHHLIAWMSWDKGDARSYLSEFRYCYGRDGEALARRVIRGQANISLFDYPLSDRVIRSARGLIVHSEYVQHSIVRVRPDAPVCRVLQGIPAVPPAEQRRPAVRQRLGIPADQFVVGSFGHMSPAKRLDVALAAFRSLLKTYPNALYLLVGSASPNYDIVHVVRKLGLEDHTRILGFVDRQSFQDYVAAADVCVNLRYPTAGETSGSVLRVMAAGLPVLVSRAGTFEELPDGTCVKVDVDEHEQDLVLEYLRLLAADAPLRQRIGANARRYVGVEHAMERTARRYMDALRQWYGDAVPLQPVRNQPAEFGAGSIAVPSAAGPMSPEDGETKSLQAPPLEDAVLDLVADAAADLGMADSRFALEDAARSWVALRPASGSDR